MQVALLWVFALKPSGRSRIGRRRSPLILIHSPLAFGGEHRGVNTGGGQSLPAVPISSPSRAWQLPEFTSPGSQTGSLGHLPQILSKGTGSDCVEGQWRSKKGLTLPCFPFPAHIPCQWLQLPTPQHTPAQRGFHLPVSVSRLYMSPGWTGGGSQGALLIVLFAEPE